MATINKKGGFGTSCFKPVMNLHETQFSPLRDNGKANVGDVWEILDVCPGDEVRVVVTRMKANTGAATMDIGDGANATRYAAALALNVVAAPAQAGATVFQATDDTIKLTFGGADVTDAEFAVQVLVTSFVAERVLIPGGEAR